MWKAALLKIGSPLSIPLAYKERTLVLLMQGNTSSILPTLQVDENKGVSIVVFSNAECPINSRCTGDCQHPIMIVLLLALGVVGSSMYGVIGVASPGTLVPVMSGAA